MHTAKHCNTQCNTHCNKYCNSCCTSRCAVHMRAVEGHYGMRHAATHCITLQHIAKYCNPLQHIYAVHIATRYNIMHHALPQTATYTATNAATHAARRRVHVRATKRHYDMQHATRAATYCNKLECTATCCNTVHSIYVVHTAIYYNTHCNTSATHTATRTATRTATHAASRAL